MYFPIPGHRRLSCDRAFVLIVRKLKVCEKLYSPNQYINIIKNSSIKNPFKIVYLNYPLTNDMKNDDNLIAKVFDHKFCYEKFVKTQLDHCVDVRIIKFNSINCEVSLKLNEPEFKSMSLFKKKNSTMNYF